MGHGASCYVAKVVRVNSELETVGAHSLEVSKQKCPGAPEGTLLFAMEGSQELWDVQWSEVEKVLDPPQEYKKSKSRTYVWFLNELQ